MRSGLVVRLIGGKYRVRDVDTNEEFECVARGNLRHRKIDSKSKFNKSEGRSSKRETTVIKLSPKVGDKCTFTVGDGVNQIEDIEERFNELSRPAISNIDQVLLVFAAKEPKFSESLLDRFLVHIEYDNIEPIIVVTKVDLLTELEYADLKEIMKYYEGMGYVVHYTSANHDLSESDLVKDLKGNVSVLAGQTGAGKSTLLNTINPDFELRTQEISQSLGRGKHTTRHSELHIVNGGFVADTPGFSSLDFGQMTVEELKDTYRDFVKMSEKCKYRGCNHVDIDGCYVQEQTKFDKNLKRRYDDYLKFVEHINRTKVRYWYELFNINVSVTN